MEKKVSKCPVKEITPTEYVMFLSLQTCSNVVIPYTTVQKTDKIPGFA